MTPTTEPQDSYLRCEKCGRTETTSFNGSLRSGWPTCCGYTMRLERTDADIGAAVGDVVAPLKTVRDAAEKAARPGES